MVEVFCNCGLSLDLAREIESIQPPLGIEGPCYYPELFLRGWEGIGLRRGIALELTASVSSRSRWLCLKYADSCFFRIVSCLLSIFFVLLARAPTGGIYTSIEGCSVPRLSESTLGLRVLISGQQLQCPIIYHHQRTPTLSLLLPYMRKHSQLAYIRILSLPYRPCPLFPLYDKVTLIHSNPNRKVYSAISKKDGTTWILKMLKKTPFNSERLMKELALHQELAHDHVVHLRNSFTHIDQKIEYAAMVLEYCSGGSLDRVIPSDDIDLVGRVGWLLDAARGLEHLHHKGIVHGDIKPQNVMLARGRAKIGDLGSAKFVQEDGDEKGTRWYVAPQILQGKSSGIQADVWSFGVLCLEVITNTRINKLIIGHAPPANREDFPSIELLEKIPQEKLRTLVKKMLSKKKDKRPTMIGVIEKLDKRLNHLKRDCQIQNIQLDLPLEQSGFDKSDPLPEWKYRLQPKKQKTKAEKYKIKTRQGMDVIVKYDDYRQTLRVTFQGMEITYNYARLPSSLKRHFRNLADVNAFLKTINTKLSFGTNGALVFPFLARLPYDPNHIRSRSNSRSNRSFQDVPNQIEEEDYPEVEPEKIIKKYVKKGQVIPQVNDDDSNLSDRLSGRSGSKGSRSGQGSHRFRERQREDRENERETEPIEEEPNQYERESQASTQTRANITIATNNPTNVTNNTIPSNTNNANRAVPSPPPPIPQPHFVPPPHVVHQDQQEILEPPQNNPSNRPPSQSSPGNSSRGASPPNRPSLPHQAPPRRPRPNPPSQNISQTIKQLLSQISFLQQVQGPERIILPDQCMSLAHLYHKQGDEQNSISYLRKAIEHYRETHRFKSDQCAQAHYYLANIIYKDQDEDDIPYRREEGPREAVVERAIVGQQLQALRELQTAAEILNSLRSYDFVTFNKVYNAMGVLYLKANSLFLAKEYFLNALTKIRDPTGRYEHRLAYRPTRNLGKLQLKDRNYADARPYLQQALTLLQIQPKLTSQLPIRNELQECCLQLKDFPSGLEHLERELALANSFQGMSASINLSRELLNRIKEELKLWIQCLLDDHSPGIVAHLKRLLTLMNKYYPEMEGLELTIKSKIDMIEQSVAR